MKSSPISTITAAVERRFDSANSNLGGTITMMMTHAEASNPSDGPPYSKDAILHAHRGIGKTELLEISYSPPAR
jgi:hypothetical protein